jgi:hypothetical protein
MPLLILATYHAFAYMSKAFAGNPLWQRRGVPVYLWLMSKQVRSPCAPCVGPHQLSSSVPPSMSAAFELSGPSDAQPWAWLSVQREAQVYNAAAEIGTGFLLIVQLLTPARSILLTFVYWCAPTLPDVLLPSLTAATCAMLFCTQRPVHAARKATCQPSMVCDSLYGAGVMVLCSPDCQEHTADPVPESRLCGAPPRRMGAD